MIHAHMAHLINHGLILLIDAWQANCLIMNMSTTQVDVHRRQQFAQALRHLSSGQMKTDAFDDLARDLIDESESSGFMDPALEGIYSHVWLLYSDWSNYRLRGRHKLPADVKEAVCRAILFLYSPYPYEWPELEFRINWWQISWSRFIARLFSSLFARRRLDLQTLTDLGATVESDDSSLWPFRRKADYESQLRRPHLLQGIKSR